MKKPMFGIWLWRWGMTIRVIGRVMQIKLVRDEMFSQRMDTRRWRVLGMSILRSRA